MKKIIILSIACITNLVSAFLPGVETKVVNGITYIQHKVSQGETLYGLAKKYNVPLETFKKVNENVSALKLNQLIWVPKPTTNTKPVQTNTTSQTATTNNNIKYHIVVKSETLYSIAKKYNVSVTDLKTWNKLGENPIALGAKLAINQYTGALQSSGEEKTVIIKGNKEVETIKEPIIEDKPKATVKVDTPKQVKITTAETTVTKTTSNITIKNDETTEIGQAVVSKSEDMLNDRCFVKHPTVPVGTILVIINPSSGKMAYCRVIENKSTQSMNNAKVEITTAVAEKIGLSGEKGQVSIRFATL